MTSAARPMLAMAASRLLRSTGTNAAKGRNKIRNVIASRVRSTLFFRLAQKPCAAPSPLLRGYRFEAGNLDLLLLPGPEFELQLARALPPCHLQPDYISRMQRSQ